MKLGNKIQLYTTGLFIILLLLIAGGIYFSFSKIVYNSDLDQTRQEAERIVTGINEQSSEVPSADLLRAYVPANGMIRIVLEDGSSDVSLTGGGQSYLIQQDYQFTRSENADIHTIEGIPHSFVSLPVVWGDGQVASFQLTQSLRTTKTNMDILRIVLVLVSILAVVPLFLSTRLLSQLITNPIRSLIQTMQQIRESGQFKQIPTQGKSKDELDQMADTFNKMIIQLQANYEAQEQFVSNASHELKTPLTIIESYASMLKRRGMVEKELFDESVEAIHGEAKQMRNLTQQLLLLAKQEEHWDLDIREVPLLPFIQSISTSFENAYQRKVYIQVEEEVRVQTDEQKLKQLLYIFMDNARKYSTDPLVISVDRKGNQSKIEISDEGIGMNEDQLERVFERFYQVDQSRTEGYGLGLSLAKALARAIGAEVSLVSQEGKGTTATILVPLSQ
ncbi:Signal transduction histidine kinase [Halobacillus dabanensis]|uniref:histidine kinase n=1 Tax=Halobacillus dabanensis TaxID=240302 RepID=A0A1I3RLX6_HALDA|nr:HAMP domain-containing sensor histidine kinase [Halobacillus dabanensis]SFJ46862.1 Signal transduction histidine kinase [Halobacillus dabanensis]